MINSTITYIEALKNIHENVIWLGPKIEPHINVKQSFFWAKKCQKIEILPQKVTQDSFKKLDKYLNKQASIFQINYRSSVSMFDFKWDDDIYGCNKAYWKDGDHFSFQGDKYFIPRSILFGFF